MTTPLLDVIHRAYPDATLTYVAGTWSKGIPEHHPLVTEVIDCGSVGIPGRYRISDYLTFARLLRRRHFDLAFVLDRSPMLTLLPWLAGIPRRIGPDSLGRGFSLTDRVPVSASPDHLQHQVEIYLDLARAIGVKADSDDLHMSFAVTPEEKEQVDSSVRRVAVFPGGGSNPGMELTAKRWPVDRYRELVRRLVQERHVQVILLGGPDDVALNETLMQGLDVPAHTVLNRAGKTTFGELAAQLSASALFIGNDSSPMHLAAAVGIPVIAIFGPTSPQEYGPYPLNDPQHIALWKNPKGHPCFFLGKMQRCTDCTCMQVITVDDVWEAVQRLIPQTQNTEVVP